MKSHIIPKALTERVYKGKVNLIQRSPYGKFMRRSDSWYDDSLVTARGEKILHEYDTWAIDFLRKNKLVWSSWGPSVVLAAADHERIPGTTAGLRRLKGVNTDRLRLFFLSVLWRAAATRLWEFNNVLLPDDELEKLRKMVLLGETRPIHFYPITLCQLPIRFFPHNFSSSRLIKKELVVDENGKIIEGEFHDIPYYRFYFDGLIAHMHIAETEERVRAAGALFLGVENELHVPTIWDENPLQLKLLNMEMSGEPNTAGQCLKSSV